MLLLSGLKNVCVYCVVGPWTCTAWQSCSGHSCRPHSDQAWMVSIDLCLWSFGLTADCVCIVMYVLFCRINEFLFHCFVSAHFVHAGFLSCGQCHTNSLPSVLCDCTLRLQMFIVNFQY